MGRSNPRNHWASDIVEICRVINENWSSKITFQEQCSVLPSLAHRIEKYVARWITMLHQVGASHSEGNLWMQLRKVLERGAQLIRLCNKRDWPPIVSAALFCKGEISEVIDDALRYAQMINRFTLHLLKCPDERSSVNKLMDTIKSDCSELQLYLRRAYHNDKARWRVEVESKNVSSQIDDAHLRLNRKLGSGSFGSVSSAVWHQLPVAVKEFVNIQHFVGELKVFQKLQEFDDNSPHILQMFGHSSTSRLVLELMDRDLKEHILMMGENKIHWEKLQKLKDLTRKHKIEWESWQKLKDQLKKLDLYKGGIFDDWGYEESVVLQSVEVMLQIAKAMKHLHSIGMVHRDLKPSNVLIKVGQDGSLLVKLADFGISKHNFLTIDENTDRRGTVMYMAPEMLEGEEKYSRKIDVYSYGLICAEIITGKIRPPKRWSQMQQLTKEGERPILPKSIPKELQTLISSCLEYEDYKRPTFNDICDGLWLVMEQVLTYNKHSPAFEVGHKTIQNAEDEKYQSSCSTCKTNKSHRERFCVATRLWPQLDGIVSLRNLHQDLLTENEPWIPPPQLSKDAPLVMSPELSENDISQELEDELSEYDLRLWFDGLEL